jgi:hypothetical protein
MYLSTFLLMITNPSTILNFAVMFTGLGFGKSSGFLATAVALILGVFLDFLVYYPKLLCETWKGKNYTASFACE